MTAFVGAADRMTVFYLDHGDTMATRDLVAGWTAPGSAAWSDPIPTGLTTNDGAGNVAIAFDAADNPSVPARQLVGSHPALEVVVCQ